MAPASDALDGICLDKKGEHYIFVLDVDNAQEVVTICRQLGRFAANPDLSFSWADAVRVARVIRSLRT